MVRLENVKSDADTASCNFIPEDSDPKNAGFIRVDRSGEYVEYIPCKDIEYADDRGYPHHARNFLKKTFDMEVVPESETVMWY